jgi:hypothetical protein
MSKFELCEKFGLTIIFGLLLTHTDLAFSSQSNRPKIEIQKPIAVNIQAYKSALKHRTKLLLVATNLSQSIQ